MKRMIVTFFAGAIAFAACALVPSTTSAQALKIGFVRDSAFQTDYKGWKLAQEEYETQMKAWDDEVNSKREALQTMQEDYDKQRLILSDEKRKEREAQLRAKYDDLDVYTKNIYGPNGMAEQKHRSLLQPLLDKISKAIEAVAIAENYDVIFTLSSIGYIKDAYDVTDKVLAYLEENG